MLTLYDYLPSQNGWKIRVVLGLLKISYRSRIVSIFEGESRSEAFLDLNPAGAIPVLEIEDGRTIAESNAILAYLAEGTPFLPTDRYQRAKVMQWLFFEQYNVEPVIGSLRFWTLTGRLDRNARWSQGSAKPEHVLSPQWTEPRQYSVSRRERPSIADIAVYAYSHRAEDCGFNLADYPAFIAWLAACEMPSVPTIPSIPTASTHIPAPEQHLQLVAAGPPATARRPSTACQISKTGAPTAMSRALFNSDTASPNSAPTPNSGARNA